MLRIFFDDTATTKIYTLSLLDALPISRHRQLLAFREAAPQAVGAHLTRTRAELGEAIHKVGGDLIVPTDQLSRMLRSDRKSTRLNSSH